jgi:hypothetical protein
LPDFGAELHFLVNVKVFGVSAIVLVGHLLVLHEDFAIQNKHPDKGE